MSRADHLERVLQTIECELWHIPAMLADGGKGIDDPEYGEQTRRLESLQAQLSAVIHELQLHPCLSVGGARVLRDALALEKKLKEACRRSAKRSVEELLGDALDRIHQYHEMIEIRDLRDLPAYIPSRQAKESLEGALVLLFAILSHLVQIRKRPNK